MGEERNSEFNRWEERRERRAKSTLDRRNYHRKNWDEKMARMKAGKKRQHHHEFQERKEWFGIFIILIGLIWLGKAFFGPYPEWMFSWQSLIIAIGLALGFASRFRNKVFFILILVGLTFMAKEYVFPDKDLEAFIWPILVIGIGILFIVKKKEEDRLHKYMQKHPEEFADWRDHWHRDCSPFWANSVENKKDEEKYNRDATKPASEQSYNTTTENKEAEKEEEQSLPNLDDWVDITNFFSGTRRTIISKQFKGGEIVNVFGGTELDLSRADISGSVTLDITNVMGGIRLAIPPNWQLNYNCTCIMGGTDDRRRSEHRHDANKTLILTGTVLMGGIEVRDII